MSATDRILAILPAGGASRRFGGGQSKLLTKINGQSVIARTVESLLSEREISGLVVVYEPSSRELFHNELAQCDPSRLHFTEGGATRQESVKNGLAYWESQDVDLSQSFVLVHDAARCLLSRSLLARCICAVKEYGAVTAAVPVADTLVKSSKQRFGELVDRESIWRVQTPQVFRGDLLLEAHASASPLATDDASLVAKTHPVHIVEGDEANLKLTLPEHVSLFEKLVS